MNVLTGLWRLDGSPVRPGEIKTCLFQSPHWQPDHQDIFISGNFALACTQRFITPEESHAPMPWRDLKSGYVLAGDVYLTNREDLIRELSAPAGLSDIELVCLAYQKWGEACPEHLCGNFMFAVWNEAKQKLFMATDHSGHYPFLYAYQKGRYFIFSNTMDAFRRLCPSLSLNEKTFAHFSLDSMLAEDTCYREVRRILPARAFSITPGGLKQNRYWKLTFGSKPLPCRTREDYYQAFRELFEKTVQSCLRTSQPVTAHISGGLDSSSIAATAARILQRQNKTLYGFTDIPNDLKERSHRPCWVSHEMPLVEKLLEQYPNISHRTYARSAETDPYKIFEPLYPYIDQPFRNTTNLEWIAACFKQTAERGGRIVLNGQCGNGSVSWKGQSYKDKIYAFYRYLQQWPRPKEVFKDYYQNHNSSFVNSRRGKKIIRARGIIFNEHRWMLSQNAFAARITGLRPLVLWYGTEYLDPTHDQKIVEFCANVPQWVYCRGNDASQKRLLMREGLKGIVPEAILQNTNRGEQSSDWPLQFNYHYPKWQAELENLPGDSPFWGYYDRTKMLNLFAPVTGLNHHNDLQINCNLMRLISLASFYSYLTSGNSPRPLKAQNAGTGSLISAL